MSDKILIELSPDWVLAFNSQQWMIARVFKTNLQGKKSRARARFHPKAFIGSTSTVLRHCIHEFEIPLTPEKVWRAINGL